MRTPILCVYRDHIRNSYHVYVGVKGWRWWGVEFSWARGVERLPNYVCV